MSTLKKEPAALKLADIRIQKLQAEHPEMFRPAPLPKIDLREFQKELLAKQLDARVGQGARAQKLLKWKLKSRRKFRVKQVAVADCKVLDTQRDSTGEKLYFELSNGQCIRADRYFPTVRIDGIKANKKDWKRFAGKRRQNKFLRQLAAVESEKNAARKEGSK